MQITCSTLCRAFGRPPVRPFGRSVWSAVWRETGSSACSARASAAILGRDRHAGRSLPCEQSPQGWLVAVRRVGAAKTGQMSAGAGLAVEQ